MVTDWRSGYATFLEERGGIPGHKVCFYVH